MTYFKPDSELYERERTVLEYIKKYPNKHHNALIKMIVPEFMAKTTFEKTRDSLLEKEIISVQKKGNMKFYTSTLNYPAKFQQHVERITNVSFHNIKTQIKKIESSYQHKDVGEKIVLANLLLKNLMQIDNGFTFLDSIKNPKKTLYRDEHLEIQEQIHLLFNMINNDKDFDTIYPTIMSYFSTNMPKNYQNSE
ncbi:MAG TPA: hypothetical protein VLD64_08295 [Nitrosarchaeum sp.]|jgi:hypothetical protein|nr:hypothetical protein [Nitrosarchaeum sp.]